MVCGQADDTAVKNRAVVIAIVLSTLLGTALRFQGLGVRDFWFDESCTFIYVHNLFDWPEGSNLLVESTNLPYYFLLRGWTDLFGDSEAAYRSMSALAASLTVPLLGLIALRLRGGFAAIVCVILAALNPIHIHYAHEARAYALWILLVATLLLSLSRAGQTMRKRSWFLFGFLLLVGLHLHYFTAYLLPATVAVVALAPCPKRALKSWFITISMVALAFVPYFVLAVWPASRGGGSSWVSPRFDAFSAISRSLWAFLPAGAYPGHLRGLSLASPDTVRFGSRFLIIANGVTRALPAAMTLGMVLYMLVRVLRGRAADVAPAPRGDCSAGDGAPARHAMSDSHGTSRSSHLFLAGMALGPLVAAWLYSVLVRPNYLVGRYDLVAWPAFTVWLSAVIADFVRSLAAPHRRFAAIVIVGMLSACSVMPIARMAALRPPPTFHHERARFLAENTNENALVVAFNYDRDYLLYYLHRLGFKGRIVSFPSWLDHQIGWVDDAADLSPARQGPLRESEKEVSRRITQTLDSGGTVLLLVDSLDPKGMGRRAPLHRGLVDAIDRAGLHVAVLDNRLRILQVTAGS